MGYNSNGQFGLGNTTNQSTPQIVSGITSFEKTCENGFELEVTTGRCWQDKQ